MQPETTPTVIPKHALERIKNTYRELQDRVRALRSTNLKSLFELISFGLTPLPDNYDGDVNLGALHDLGADRQNVRIYTTDKSTELILSYLRFKQVHGCEVEREFYRNLSNEDFIRRLILNKPLRIDKHKDPENRTHPRWRYYFAPQSEGGDIVSTYQHQEFEEHSIQDAKFRCFIRERDIETLLDKRGKENADLLDGHIWESLKHCLSDAELALSTLVVTGAESEIFADKNPCPRNAGGEKKDPCANSCYVVVANSINLKSQFDRAFMLIESQDPHISNVDKSLYDIHCQFYEINRMPTFDEASEAIIQRPEQSKHRDIRQDQQCFRYLKLNSRRIFYIPNYVKKQVEILFAAVKSASHRVEMAGSDRYPDRRELVTMAFDLPPELKNAHESAKAFIRRRVAAALVFKIQESRLPNISLLNIRARFNKATVDCKINDASNAPIVIQIESATGIGSVEPKQQELLSLLSKSQISAPQYRRTLLLECTPTVQAGHSLLRRYKSRDEQVGHAGTTYSKGLLGRSTVIFSQAPFLNPRLRRAEIVVLSPSSFLSVQTFAETLSDTFYTIQHTFPSSRSFLPLLSVQAEQENVSLATAAATIDTPPTPTLNSVQQSPQSPQGNQVTSPRQPIRIEPQNIAKQSSNQQAERKKISLIGKSSTPEPLAIRILKAKVSKRIAQKDRWRGT